jgi:hypothetical protein
LLDQISSDSTLSARADEVRAAFPSARDADGSGWRGGYWESRARRGELRRRAKDQAARARAAELVEAFGLRAGERAPEARAAGALSLEELTLVHQRQVRTGWSCTLFEYPGGEVELRAHYVGPSDERPRTVREKAPEFVRPVDPLDAALFERFEQSVARSRQQCMRRCMALQADHMLTLTKRGKFESLDEVWAVFEKFSQSMRRLFGDRWRFVAVPELHKSGGYHMHVALNGFWWVGILRKLWMRALGGTGREQGDETPGNIDIKSFARVRGAGWRIARYVAKYLGKGFSSLDRGRRSYSSSRGLHPSRVTRWREPLHGGSTDAAVSLRQRLTDVGFVGTSRTWHWEREGRVGFVITLERRQKC